MDMYDVLIWLYSTTLTCAFVVKLYYDIVLGRESALNGEVHHIEEVEMLTSDGRPNDSESEEDEIFNARVDR